jgi:hypothetical protein
MRSLVHVCLLLRTLRLLSVLIAALALSSAASAQTARTWTGNVGSLWSNFANWSPSGVPTNGDRLVFPAASTALTSANDLFGLSLGGITFLGSGYVLSGNAIALAGPYSSAGGNTINFAIDVRASGVNLSGVLGNPDVFGGRIEVNSVGVIVGARINAGIDVKTYGATLGGNIAGGLSGTGPVRANAAFIGASAYSGIISGSGGPIHFADATMPGAGVTDADVFGTGTIGPLTATALRAGQVNTSNTNINFQRDNYATGTLSTGSLLLKGTLTAMIKGGIPDTGYSRINVAGTVTLNSIGPSSELARLALAIDREFAPTIGQTLVLVSNDGTDPVLGTFAGMPEGFIYKDRFTDDSYQISYVGGDGNDITITCVGGTKTWTGAVNNLWSNPGNWRPAGVLSDGISLVFPGGIPSQSVVNDLPSLRVGGLSINGILTIDGNALALAGSVTSTESAIFNIPIDIVADGVTLNGRLAFNRRVDVNAHGVTLGGSYSSGLDIHNNDVTLVYAQVAGGLAGTGNLTILGPVDFAGDGTFSGSIFSDDRLWTILSLKSASLPNAKVQGPSISLGGNGTIGAATVQFISPSQVYWNGTSFTQYDSTGLIDTGDLRITGEAGFLIKGFAPGNGYSQVRVTGTITIDPNATLRVVADASLDLNSQQEFILIKNDGTEPIAGYFKGTPEGTPLTLNGITCFISYKGGDGNDLALRTAPPKVWTGTASALWSNGNNWNPIGTPTSGDSLVFPTSASNFTNTNDLVGLSLTSIQAFDNSYVINGNAITLSGVTALTLGGRINLPISVRTPATLRRGSLGGAVDIASSGVRLEQVQTLAPLSIGTNAVNLDCAWISGGLQGSGTMSIDQDRAGAASVAIVRGGGGYSGRFTSNLYATLGLDAVELGAADASLPNGTVIGNGSIGNVEGRTVLAGRFDGYGAILNSSCTNVSHGVWPTGVLNTRNLTWSGGGYAQFEVGREPPGVPFSRINAKGSVTIGAQTILTIFVLPASRPIAGQQFTLVDNDGSDPVSGTFQDFPEGAKFRSDGAYFSISYRGGDGNDIVITALEDSLPTVTLSASANPAPLTQPLVLTALVTSAQPGVQSTGKVRFYEWFFDRNPTELGTADLVAGRATVSVDPNEMLRNSSRYYPTRNIGAQYLGDSQNQPAYSPPYYLQLVVSPDVIPVVRVVSSKNPSNVGDSVTFTATVTGPKFSPTGWVTFFDGALPLQTVSLSNGVAAFTTSSLTFGNHDIRAYFSGDPNHIESVVSLSGGQAVTQPGVPLSILPDTLPNGVVGSLYATTILSVVGGVQPYSFSVLGGGLPPGLTISANGILSGSPSGSGTFSFAIRATDAAAATVQRTYSVTIANALTTPLIAQQIIFASPGTQTVGGSLTLSASASSGLAVQFSSLTPAVCAVSANVATFISAGNCSIAADQFGNSVYAAATRVVQSFIVSAPSSPMDQTLTFANPGLQVVGTTLNLLATASSGLPVVFTSLSTTVCTVSGSIATFVAVGNCAIAADQPGGASYRAANRVTRTWSVVIGVPTAPLNLVCVPIPAGASCTFLPPASQGTGPVLSYFLYCNGPTNGSGNGVQSSPATIQLREWQEAYTCTIAATNSTGMGPVSVRSSAFYPLPSPNIPATPSLNRVFPGQNQALVTFTGVEANPQFPMLYVRVISSPDDRQGACSVPCSSITVSGLSNNIPYTFTVVAFSFEGPSIPSAPSAPIVTGTPLSGYPAPISQRGGGIDVYRSGKSQVLLQATGTGSYLEGSLSGSQLMFAPVVQVPAGTRPIALGDFSSTGRSDFMYQDTSNADPSMVSIAKLPNGTASNLRNLKRAWMAQAVGDMDGDGTSDVVFRYTGTDGRPDDTGVSYIWFMKNGTVEQVRKRGGAPLSWTLLGAADINGDFAADMVYISPTNQVRVLMSTPNRTCANLSAGSLPVGYQALKLADFQGNGRAAILAQHAVTKSVILYTLDARSVTLPAPTADPDDPNASCTASSKEVTTSTTNFPTIPSGDFYAVGDFNGDGFFDILWKLTTGSLVLWQMGSNTALPTITPGVGTAPPSSIVIQP